MLRRYIMGVCVLLADEAGDIVRGVAAGGHLGGTSVKDKSKSGSAQALDPQTQADRRAERLIVATLSRRFGPGEGVMKKKRCMSSSYSSYSPSACLFAYSHSRSCMLRSRSSA